MGTKIRLNNMISFNSNGYFYQLSSGATESSSWRLIEHYHQEANRCFQRMGESLCRYREDNGDTCETYSSNLKPTNSRLQFELVALVSQLLINSLPDLDNIIDNDSTINETDKKICKLAYQNLQSQIQNLINMFGPPCFGFKKDEEKVEE